MWEFKFINLSNSKKLFLASLPELTRLPESYCKGGRSFWIKFESMALGLLTLGPTDYFI